MKSKILNRQVIKKPQFWVLDAVIFGFISVGFGITAFWIRIFGYVYLPFVMISLGCGCFAIKLLVENRKILKFSGIIQLLILILSAFYMIFFLFIQSNNFISWRATENKNLAYLKQIRIAINEFIADNGHLPNADSWCNSLLNNINNSEIFQHFAFNASLSNVTVYESLDKAVLVFEAEDGINKSGGADLLIQGLDRDKYCLLPWQKVTYILLVDGTILKYRRSDGAISKYEGSYDKFGYNVTREDYKAFSSFIEKEDSNYNPLQWK